MDAIVCKADADPEGTAAYTLQRSLKLASAFHGLPESYIHEVRSYIDEQYSRGWRFNRDEIHERWQTIC